MKLQELFETNDLEIEIGDFSCFNRKLKTLEGAVSRNDRQFEVPIPKKIGGMFSCRNNKLTNLKGGPDMVLQKYTAADNQISSLEGMPSKVGVFDLRDNKLTSLEGIHKIIKSADAIILTKNPIKSHILGLLKIKSLQWVKFDDETVENIMNEGLKSGDILKAQQELIDAGFEEMAKL